MTLTQFVEAYYQVCQGPREPILIQLSSVDFASLAKLMCLSPGQWQASQLINQDTFNEILWQGYFMIFGIVCVRDKDLFHPIGLIRFWLSKGELREVNIKE